MDMVLKKDASRIRKGFASATGIRYLCLNLFQKEGSKISLNKKRMTAAWDDDFRCKVLFA